MATAAVLAGALGTLVTRAAVAQTSRGRTPPTPPAVSPAEDPPPPAPPPPPPPPAPAPAPAPNLVDGFMRLASRATFTLGGYLESYYSWNFNQPSNGITNFRGFDNRHNQITVAAVALDASVALDRVSARITLQYGHATAAEYLVEPSVGGTASVAPSSGDLWRYLQQAFIGWRAPVGRGLLFELGLLLTPVGPETFPVHDNWNWSRSNFFMAVPFYHAGLRVTYPVSDQLSLMALVCNGWNNVLDNNDEKSFALNLSYSVTDRVTFSATYFSGVERPTGAPEGRAWRQLFDTHVTYQATPAFAFQVHADGGFEPGSFGLTSWFGAAVAARLRLAPWLYAAVRGDFIFEHDAANVRGRAGAILIPAEWVTEGTATLDYRPVSYLSFRLEYRHDHAASNAYFSGIVVGDGIALPYVPNARAQDTVTFGGTAWF